ncbi:Uncharacterized protein Adt_22161 [Abeliophyllum distichum]|uniref:Uncharacterized protein n=1 Tax=Abeliophyllum distichum TaxID=126358 RepID=A0ABD1T1N3_9LAMI
MVDKDDPQRMEMDHIGVVHEVLLETTKHGHNHMKPYVRNHNRIKYITETEEDPGVQFFDSEDDVNQDNFVHDRNVEECITVGLNSDPVVEVRHVDAIGKNSDSDHSYDPTTADLNTDYSSDEERNVRYPTFNDEKKMWDPQFEVGKTVIDVPQFRKVIKNHGVATGCNLRMKTNDDKDSPRITNQGKVNWFSQTFLKNILNKMIFKK